MRVLILSHSYFVPENRKNIYAIARLCEVKCVLPDRFNIKYGENGIFEIEEENKEYFIPYKSLNIFGDQYFLAKLNLATRNFRPEIINVEYNPWSLMFLHSLIYRKIYARNAKIICTMKKNTFVKKSRIFGAIKFLIARLLVKKVDHFLVVSEMVRNLLINTFSIPSSKISIIQHLGVDTGIFSPNRNRKKINNEKFLIGFCGRLAKHKGVEDLIEAVLILKEEKGYNSELILLGEEDSRGWLDIYAKYSWLKILPPVSLSEVADFLRRLDIFVLPSRILPDHQEHDAHALLEALATGIPCVGTRSGIIPEIIGDGTGWLVDPRDPKGLAQTLEELILDTKYRRELETSAEKKAKNEFSLDILAKKRVQIFKELLNEK
jgi:glycosyltransferase involved in cell wall biosynthesis